MIDYLVAMIHVRIHKARTAPSRGASAVEWAIITAIIAGVALGLAALDPGPGGGALGRDHLQLRRW